MHEASAYLPVYGFNTLVGSEFVAIYTFTPGSACNSNIATESVSAECPKTSQCVCEVLTEEVMKMLHLPMILLTLSGRKHHLTLGQNYCSEFFPELILR